MELQDNQHSIKSLKDMLNKKYGSKVSGEKFNDSDIAQYCLRGALPYRYGGNELKVESVKGFKIITIGESTIKA
jgi:hypothetical protein